MGTRAHHLPRRRPINLDPVGPLYGIHIDCSIDWIDWLGFGRWGRLSIDLQIVDLGVAPASRWPEAQNLKRGQ